MVKTWPNKFLSVKPAVDSVSFEIMQGEIFGLLGPSGAGKTTTQRVLTCQQRSSPARCGCSAKHWLTGDRSISKKSASVSSCLTLKFTAVENLGFFASLYTKKSRDPLELLGMVGLESEARKKVDEFSKGMRMRLNFIRVSARSEALVPRRADGGSRRGSTRATSKLSLDDCATRERRSY